MDINWYLIKENEKLLVVVLQAVDNVSESCLDACRCCGAVVRWYKLS